MKWWADGSTQGFTAALEEPYRPKNPKWLTPAGPNGLLNYPDSAELQAQVQAALHDKGWSAAIHTNGDAALKQVLEIYAAVMQKLDRTLAIRSSTPQSRARASMTRCGGSG